MSKKELTASNEIFAAFDKRFENLTVAAIDDDIDNESGRLHLLHAGSEPVFLFSLANEKKDKSYILIYHESSSIKIFECMGVPPNVGEVVLEHYDMPEDVDLVGMMELRETIMPFDVDYFLDIEISKAGIVRDLSGRILGLFLWLSHGSEIAFAIGYYDELMTLTGNNVALAFDAALEKSNAGELAVEFVEYESFKNYGRFCKDYNWFDYK